MPPSIRPEPVILDEILTGLLSSGLVTDIAPISVLRQLSSALSITLAEMYYSLWTVYQSYFMGLSAGADLDTRGRDMNFPRDLGQPSSGEVLYTRASTYLEDVVLTVPQQLQAVVAAGDPPKTYSTIVDARLESCGRSISGDSPLTQIVSGVNDRLQVNLDGDGAQTLILGTQGTGQAIALAIQTAVRALFAATPALQSAYDRFTCDWNTITPARFTLRSGNPGPTSSVVVTDAATANATPTLKLGVAQGGDERVGMDTLLVPVLADTLGSVGNIGTGQVTVQTTQAPGILSVTNLLPFVDGREPASDDAYRQALQRHIVSLGRGTPAYVLEQVQDFRVASGQQPIHSAQVVAAGDAHVAVFIADGRSLTVGAQAVLVQAIQDEADGRGTIPGGIIPAGVTALVRPALVRVVHVHCLVLVSRLGPPNDIAQRQAVQTITETLTRAPVGATVTYIDMLRALDVDIPEILRIDFVAPAAWSVTPQLEIEALVGQKLMPGTIMVEIERG